MWKEKLPVAAILNSQKISLHGRGGDIWKCQKIHLVMCVRTYSQVGKAFRITRRPTVGSRNTIAHSAINHLSGVITWKLTPSFTVEKNRTSAHSASFHAARLPTSKSILRGTLGKNFTIAINVSMKQQDQTTYKCTRRLTLEKNHIDAWHAIIQALALAQSKFTWWGSIQGKSRSSVASATMPALLQAICWKIWGCTSGREHSSTINAKTQWTTTKIVELGN